MYKIVVRDYNSPAFVTSCVSYYADDIEEFQRRWFALEIFEARKERFLKSKSGVYESDVPFIDEDGSFDMVQTASDYECLFEKTVELKNQEVIVRNGFDWETLFCIDNLKIFYRYIRFKGAILKIGRFEIKGVCEKDASGEGGFVRVDVWGNRVIEMSETSHLPYRSADKSTYSEVIANSIAYKELNEFDSEFGAGFDWGRNVVDKEDLNCMFSDFLGDAN